MDKPLTGMVHGVPLNFFVDEDAEETGVTLFVTGMSLEGAIEVLKDADKISRYGEELSGLSARPYDEE